MIRRATRRGFTLVEVLAALAFLGILIPVVVSALTVSNRAAVIAERSGIAAQLGENQLNQMVVESSWSSSGTGGDFGEDWPGYRWELKKSDWNTGSVTELTMNVFFQVQGQERSVQLGTLATDSLTTQ